MKKTFAALSLLGVLLFGNACSNDFDLTAEWKDIPVVYGMLEPGKTSNYIRVEKVFLDPKTNALTLAKIADSLYYNNITVQLERVKLAQTIPLERVDGTQEGYVRDEGVFATAPNYLYKFQLTPGNELKGGEEVRLVINRSDNKAPVISKTTIVGPSELVESQPNSTITWEYNRKQRIAWRPGERSVIFDVTMYIHILESQPNSPNEFQKRTLEWPLARGVQQAEPNEVRMTIEVLGEDFFKFIQSQLKDEPNNVIRRFSGIDLEVIAGGQELLEYIRLRQANTGITSSQIVPTYSNIDGGLGLFTSRSVARRQDLTISGVSIDSLIDGIYTRNLNFRK